MKTNVFKVGLAALAILAAVVGAQMCVGCAPPGGGTVNDACYYARQVCASAEAICQVVQRRGVMSELDASVEALEKNMDTLRIALMKRNAFDTSSAEDFHLKRMEAYVDSLTAAAYATSDK